VGLGDRATRRLDFAEAIYRVALPTSIERDFLGDWAAVVRPVIVTAEYP